MFQGKPTPTLIVYDSYVNPLPLDVGLKWPHDPVLAKKVCGVGSLMREPVKSFLASKKEMHEEMVRVIPLDIFYV